MRRHPHVFGEKRAKNAEEALQSWLAVKDRERRAEPSHKNARKSLLDGIAPAYPATLEAYELGIRAAEVGFDWAKVEDLLGKIEEEIRELKRELPLRPAHDARRVEEEVGDLLFAAANLARYLHTDPESCLRRANQKFKLRECGPEELDSIWEELKTREGK
jgi:uncharacterized protein YabN with tetrapyrrole methylase and pyrophosphatase domain